MNKHFNLAIFYLAASLFPFLLCIEANAKYGDTERIALDSPIPRGWAVKEVYISGNTKYATIIDLRRAPYLAEEVVHIRSPLPSGWVVTDIAPSDSVSICNLNDFDRRRVRSKIDAVNILKGSPIPDGWVITSKFISSNRTHYCIENITQNATKRRSITVLEASPIPSGWIINETFIVGEDKYHIIHKLP